MTSREDMAARVTDAETKLAAAVEAARRAEVTAARMGEQDVLVTSLRTQLARADDSLARLTETHESNVADLRRDWERRERDLERRLAEKDLAAAASTAEWERKVSEVSDTMRRDMSDVKVSAARDVSDAEARAKVAEDRANASRAEVDKANERAHAAEVAAKDRSSEIERDLRFKLSELARETSKKDNEISNLTRRLDEAKAHGDRLERQCMETASRLHDATIKASASDELVRTRAELAEVRTELREKTAALEQSKASVDAAFERDKDSDRRARDATEERVKALAKLESHAAEHEREVVAREELVEVLQDDGDGRVGAPGAVVRQRRHEER